MCTSEMMMMMMILLHVHHLSYLWSSLYFPHCFLEHFITQTLNVSDFFNIMHISLSPGNGNKCHNGGVCVEGPGLEFTCKCADGWGGRFCSINIDDCESSPCLNGGVCIDKVAGYACSCSKEYTGPNCEENIKVCNDSPCKNSALCLMEEGQPICYCVPDFHGEKCEYQYDECQIGPR